jgi:hypothetical protein
VLLEEGGLFKPTGEDALVPCAFNTFSAGGRVTACTECAHLSKATANASATSVSVKIPKMSLWQEACSERKQHAVAGTQDVAVGTPKVTWLLSQQERGTRTPGLCLRSY